MRLAPLAANAGLAVTTSSSTVATRAPAGDLLPTLILFGCFGAAAFLVAGAAFATVRYRWHEERQIDPLGLTLGVGATMLGLLLTPLLGGFLAIPAVGLPAVLGGYVMSAQQIGYFLVETGPIDAEGRLRRRPWPDQVPE